MMDSSLNSANQSVSPDLGDAKLTPDCEINLCDDFNPGPWDVICSRGMVSFANEGNIRLREMVDGSVEEYLQADRNERVAIVSRIIDTVMTKANVGFVRQDSDTNRWMKVSRRTAREKVGQALRAALKKKGLYYSGKPSGKPMSRAAKPKARTKAGGDSLTALSTKRSNFTHSIPPMSQSSFSSFRQGLPDPSLQLLFDAQATMPARAHTETMPADTILNTGSQHIAALASFEHQPHNSATDMNHKATEGEQQYSSQESFRMTQPVQSNQQYLSFHQNYLHPQDTNNSPYRQSTSPSTTLTRRRERNSMEPRPMLPMHNLDYIQQYGHGQQTASAMSTAQQVSRWMNQASNNSYQAGLRANHDPLPQPRPSSQTLPSAGPVGLSREPLQNHPILQLSRQTSLYENDGLLQVHDQNLQLERQIGSFQNGPLFVRQQTDLLFEEDPFPPRPRTQNSQFMRQTGELLFEDDDSDYPQNLQFTRRQTAALFDDPFPDVPATLSAPQQMPLAEQDQLNPFWAASHRTSLTEHQHQLNPFATSIDNDRTLFLTRTRSRQPHRMSLPTGNSIGTETTAYLQDRRHPDSFPGREMENYAGQQEQWSISDLAGVRFHEDSSGRRDQRPPAA